MCLFNWKNMLGNLRFYNWYFALRFYNCYFALHLWSYFTLDTISSGLEIGLTHCVCQVQIFARIKTLVTKPDALRTGVSASDAAITLGIAPGMAKEHLLTAESKGELLHNFLIQEFIFVFSRTEPGSYKNKYFYYS